MAVNMIAMLREIIDGNMLEQIKVAAQDSEKEIVKEEVKTDMLLEGYRLMIRSYLCLLDLKFEFNNLSSWIHFFPEITFKEQRNQLLVQNLNEELFDDEDSVNASALRSYLNSRELLEKK